MGFGLGNPIDKDCEGVSSGIVLSRGEVSEAVFAVEGLDFLGDKRGLRQVKYLATGGSIGFDEIDGVLEPRGGRCCAVELNLEREFQGGTQRDGAGGALEFCHVSVQTLIKAEESHGLSISAF